MNATNLVHLRGRPISTAVMTHV
uniref:Uncharacterized protein n=1 Tax=Anguilla anguilla TaxID=7936 RepID=A0A0E9W2C5_ANGAN